MNPTRVLLADDHQVLRAGLAGIIRLDPEFTIVGEADNGEEVVQLCRELRPDLLITDLRMPGMGGVRAIEAIRADFPNMKVIVFTAFAGDEEIFRALQAGAKAYLLKNSTPRELMQTIREVRYGNHRLPDSIGARLAERFPLDPLTRREVDILNELAKGMKAKTISPFIGIRIKPFTAPKKKKTNRIPTLKN